MRGPVDLTQALLGADVLHEIVHLRRRIDDALELPDVLDVPESACLTVRLYDADSGLVAALVPAGRLPATGALAAAAGSQTIRATPPGRVSTVTDCHPALVPPVGLPPEVTTVADLALRDQEVVYAATGDGSTALKIRTADLLAVTGAVVAPLVEPGAALRPVAATWRSEPVGAYAPMRY